MATRIYTKTGDRGETGLFGGRRVRKDDARVEAYGVVDELGAALGQARASTPPPALDDLLQRLQCLLFELGSELATDPAGKPPPSAVTAADVAWLEEAIDAASAPLPPLRAFILAGGTAAAAALHQARTVCRRAERRVVTLMSVEPDTSATAVVFLNRLSDLLFVLARQANHLAGVEDVKWVAREGRAEG
jgi:cob(I)alamin adenosyltransferase